MTRSIRCRLLPALAAIAALAAVLSSPAARAQGADTFPNKPISMIVPYPAGGTTDQLARAIAGPMQEMLGQPVVIFNKPGAGGTIGMDAVAKAAPDGYTLAFGNSGPSATAALMRKLPYDVLKDFRPLSAVVTVPLILAVPATSPYKTVKDFVNWARTQGTKLNYGSTGIGGSSHLASEFFNERAGIKVQHIPYAGGSPMVAALAAGRIDMSFVTGLDGAAMLQAGKIRYLGVASPKRTSGLPGLPAIDEDVPGFSAVVWFGVLAPKGVPDDIAAKLANAVAKAVSRPEVHRLFVERNVEPSGSTPKELEQMIKDELRIWGPVVEKNNIKVE